MPKWAKTIDWLAINTSALSLLIFLQFLSAFFPHPIEGSNNQAQAHTAYEAQETERRFNWGFWEALFTGFIAAVAFREFYENRKGRERELRAYVFVENCTLSRNPDGTGPWSILLVLKNYGNTPAANVTVKHERDVRTAIPATQLLDFSQGAQTTTPLPIPPGHINTSRMPIVQGDFDWAAARADGRQAYLWARVEYTDAFEKDRWLTVQMAHAFDDVENFSFCPVGNDFR
jgi:hypothetical protein